MLVAFLVIASSLARAGVSVESYDYDAECSLRADLDEPFLPEEAVFAGWFESGSRLEGLSDGAFSWMVSGWSDYGYQQGITPYRQGGQVDAWGWASISEGTANPELEIVSIDCNAGATCALTGWDDPSLLLSAPTLIAEDEQGEAETLSLDRVSIDLDIGALAVSCDEIGWDSGTPVTLTISWFRSTP